MERFDSRPSCIRCVWKHLSKAVVLAGEYLSLNARGESRYKIHLLLMNGNIAEAEEESGEMFPAMSAKICEVRLRIEEAKFAGAPLRDRVITLEDVEEILRLGGCDVDGLPLDSDSPAVVVEIADPTPDPDVPTIEVPEKISPMGAGYMVLGNPDRFCMDCDKWMGFTDPEKKVSGECALVEGSVFTIASCDLFEPKKKS